MSFDGATNYIGGRWLPAQSGQTFESRSPACLERVIGAFARSAKVDIADAVDAAARAFPAWRGTPAPARAAVIQRMGRLLEERKEELARQMVAEMGKVLVEARGDVQEAIDMAYYIAAFGRMPNGSVAPSEREDIFCMARRVPVGVVGLITP